MVAFRAIYSILWANQGQKAPFCRENTAAQTRQSYRSKTICFLCQPKPASSSRTPETMKFSPQM